MGWYNFALHCQIVLFHETWQELFVIFLMQFHVNKAVVAIYYGQFSTKNLQ